ncbi:MULTISPECIES: hypothetical protein [Actibacterium]|uniref:Uncharacterized protein n=1 Tax=Actibacterium naphthalenivorans TaxID=1614693 RepID=A0A840C751_9RHOB|nr:MULTISPECIES: hypothetical protein [Actibacterium]MBB4021754.1 hypothetical protein [Actibacterium naphthalenivorans]
MSSTNIDEIAAIIRRIESAAYERGKVDAKREMLAHLTSVDSDIKAPVAEPRAHKVSDPVHIDDRPASERKRAPKGIVPRFVMEVLASNPGLTPKEISNRAATDFEKMIKATSIRSELRNGKASGKYREDSGRWFLAQTNKGEAEEQSLPGEPSASNSNHERTKDAPSVDADDLI